MSNVCNFEMPEDYILLLRTLYTEEMGKVVTDVESRFRPIERGIKGGDPLSALLSVSVLEHCMRKLKEKLSKLNWKWRGHGSGIVIDAPDEPLSNLRFDDDLLLIAQNKSNARKVLLELQVTASTYGLKLRLGKIKILALSPTKHEHVVVAGNLVCILADGEFERFLGRELSFFDFHAVELKNRVSAGWASFAKFKAELCNQRVAVNTRKSCSKQ